MSAPHPAVGGRRAKLRAHASRGSGDAGPSDGSPRAEESPPSAPSPRPAGGSRARLGAAKVNPAEFMKMLRLATADAAAVAVYAVTCVGLAERQPQERLELVPAAPSPEPSSDDPYYSTGFACPALGVVVTLVAVRETFAVLRIESAEYAEVEAMQLRRPAGVPPYPSRRQRIEQQARRGQPPPQCPSSAPRDVDLAAEPRPTGAVVVDMTGKPYCVAATLPAVVRIDNLKPACDYSLTIRRALAGARLDGMALTAYRATVRTASCVELHRVLLLGDSFATVSWMRPLSESTALQERLAATLEEQRLAALSPRQRVAQEARARDLKKKAAEAAEAKRRFMAMPVTADAVGTAALRRPSTPDVIAIVRARDVPVENSLTLIPHDPGERLVEIIPPQGPAHPFASPHGLFHSDTFEVRFAPVLPPEGCRAAATRRERVVFFSDGSKLTAFGLAPATTYRVAVRARCTATGYFSPWSPIRIVATLARPRWAVTKATTREAGLEWEQSATPVPRFDGDAAAATAASGDCWDASLAAYKGRVANDDFYERSFHVEFPVKPKGQYEGRAVEVKNAASDSGPHSVEVEDLPKGAEFVAVFAYTVKDEALAALIGPTTLRVVGCTMGTKKQKRLADMIEQHGGAQGLLKTTRPQALAGISSPQQVTPASPVESVVGKYAKGRMSVTFGGSEGSSPGSTEDREDGSVSVRAETPPGSHSGTPAGSPGTKTPGEGSFETLDAGAEAPAAAAGTEEQEAPQAQAEEEDDGSAEEDVEEAETMSSTSSQAANPATKIMFISSTESSVKFGWVGDAAVQPGTRFRSKVFQLLNDKTILPYGFVNETKRWTAREIAQFPRPKANQDVDDRTRTFESTFTAPSKNEFEISELLSNTQYGVKLCAYDEKAGVWFPWCPPVVMETKQIAQLTVVGITASSVTLKPSMQEDASRMELKVTIVGSAGAQQVTKFYDAEEDMVINDLSGNCLYSFETRKEMDEFCTDVFSWSPKILLGIRHCPIEVTPWGEDGFDVQWYSRDISAIPRGDHCRFYIVVTSVSTGKEERIDFEHLPALGRHRFSALGQDRYTVELIQVVVFNNEPMWQAMQKSFWKPKVASIALIRNFTIVLARVGEEHAAFFAVLEELSSSLPKPYDIAPKTLTKNNETLLLSALRRAVNVPADTGGILKDIILFEVHIARKDIRSQATRNIIPSPQLGGVISGLLPDKPYSLRLRPQMSTGAAAYWGAWSECVSFTTPGKLTLDADVVGEDFVHLSWSRKLPYELPFEREEGKALRRFKRSVTNLEEDEAKELVEAEEQRWREMRLEREKRKTARRERRRRLFPFDAVTGIAADELQAELQRQSEEKAANDEWGGFFSALTYFIQRGKVRRRMAEEKLRQKARLEDEADAERQVLIQRRQHQAALAAKIQNGVEVDPSKIEVFLTGEEEHNLRRRFALSSDTTSEDPDEVCPYLNFIYNYEAEGCVWMKVEGSKEPSVHPSPYDETQFLLSGLTPGVRHAIKFRQRNLIGEWSLWSNHIMIQTLTDIRVTVHEVGEEYVSLSCSRSPMDMDDETAAEDTKVVVLESDRTKVTAYQIRTTFRSSNCPAHRNQNPGEDIRDISLEHFSDVFQVKNLLPDSLYSVCVRVQVRGGYWGHWSELVNFRTAKAAQVELLSVSETTMKIHVYRPALDKIDFKNQGLTLKAHKAGQMLDQQGPQLAPVARWKVFVQGQFYDRSSDGWEHRKDIYEQSETVINLRFLKPDSVYKIFIKSVDLGGAVSSTSPPSYIATKPETTFKVTKLGERYAMVTITRAPRGEETRNFERYQSYVTAVHATGRTGGGGPGVSPKAGSDKKKKKRKVSAAQAQMRRQGKKVGMDGNDPRRMTEEEKLAAEGATIIIENGVDYNYEICVTAKPCLRSESDDSTPPRDAHIAVVPTDANEVKVLQRLEPGTVYTCHTRALYDWKRPPPMTEKEKEKEREQQRREKLDRLGNVGTGQHDTDVKESGNKDGTDEGGGGSGKPKKTATWGRWGSSKVFTTLQPLRVHILLVKETYADVFLQKRVPEDVGSLVEMSPTYQLSINKSTQSMLLKVPKEGVQVRLTGLRTDTLYDVLLRNVIYSIDPHSAMAKDLLNVEEELARAAADLDAAQENRPFDRHLSANSMPLTQVYDQWYLTFSLRTLPFRPTIPVLYEARPVENKQGKAVAVGMFWRPEERVDELHLPTLRPKYPKGYITDLDTQVLSRKMDENEAYIERLRRVADMDDHEDEAVLSGDGEVGGDTTEQKNLKVPSELRQIIGACESEAEVVHTLLKRCDSGTLRHFLEGMDAKHDDIMPTSHLDVPPLELTLRVSELVDPATLSVRPHYSRMNFSGLSGTHASTPIPAAYHPLGDATQANIQRGAPVPKPLCASPVSDDGEGARDPRTGGLRPGKVPTWTDVNACPSFSRYVRATQGLIAYCADDEPENEEEAAESATQQLVQFRPHNGLDRSYSMLSLHAKQDEDLDRRLIDPVWSYAQRAAHEDGYLVQCASLISLTADDQAPWVDIGELTGVGYARIILPQGNLSDYAFRISRRSSEADYLLNKYNGGEIHDRREGEEEPESSDVVTKKLWSRFSAAVAWSEPHPPFRCRQLHTRAVRHDAAVLDWLPPENAAVHNQLTYEVYGMRIGADDKWVLMARVRSFSCILQHLAIRSQYKVFVRAISTFGDGEVSNVVRFTTALHVADVGALGAQPTQKGGVIVAPRPPYTPLATMADAAMQNPENPRSPYYVGGLELALDGVAKDDAPQFLMPKKVPAANPPRALMTPRSVAGRGRDRPEHHAAGRGDKRSVSGRRRKQLRRREETTLDHIDLDEGTAEDSPLAPATQAVCKQQAPGKKKRPTSGGSRRSGRSPRPLSGGKKRPGSGGSRRSKKSQRGALQLVPVDAGAVAELPASPPPAEAVTYDNWQPKDWIWAYPCSRRYDHCPPPFPTPFHFPDPADPARPWFARHSAASQTVIPRRQYFAAQKACTLTVPPILALPSETTSFALAIEDAAGGGDQPQRTQATVAETLVSVEQIDDESPRRKRDKAAAAALGLDVFDDTLSTASPESPSRSSHSLRGKAVKSENKRPTKRRRSYLAPKQYRDDEGEEKDIRKEDVHVYRPPGPEELLVSCLARPRHRRHGAEEIDDIDDGHRERGGAALQHQRSRFGHRESIASSAHTQASADSFSAAAVRKSVRFQQDCFSTGQSKAVSPRHDTPATPALGKGGNLKTPPSFEKPFNLDGGSSLALVPAGEEPHPDGLPPVEGAAGEPMLPVDVPRLYSSSLLDTPVNVNLILDAAAEPRARTTADDIYALDKDSMDSFSDAVESHPLFPHSSVALTDGEALFDRPMRLGGMMPPTEHITLARPRAAAVEHIPSEWRKASQQKASPQEALENLRELIPDMPTNEFSYNAMTIGVMPLWASAMQIPPSAATQKLQVEATRAAQAASGQRAMPGSQIPLVPARPKGEAQSTGRYITAVDRRRAGSIRRDSTTSHIGGVMLAFKTARRGSSVANEKAAVKGPAPAPPQRVIPKTWNATRDPDDHRHDDSGSTLSWESVGEMHFQHLFPQHRRKRLKQEALLRAQAEAEHHEEQAAEAVLKEQEAGVAQPDGAKGPTAAQDGNPEAVPGGGEGANERKDGAEGQTPAIPPMDPKDLEALQAALEKEKEATEAALALQAKVPSSRAEARRGGVFGHDGFLPG